MGPVQHAEIEREAAVAARLGDLLLANGRIPPEAIETALDHQVLWGCRLGEALLALGLIDEATLIAALAVQFDLPVLDQRAFAATDDVVDAARAVHYARSLVVPWAVLGTRTAYATADPAAARRSLLGDGEPDNFSLVLATKDAVHGLIAQRCGAVLALAASEALDRSGPLYSARTNLAAEQKPVVAGMLGAVGLALVTMPVQTMTGLGVAGAFGFTATLTLRLVAAAMSLRRPGRAPAALAPYDATLPPYTILVPLYQEARSIPGLIAALRALDYPAAKLDIKLILEADDPETAAAVAALRLPPTFETIMTPPLGPRTKPKACNYALHFARGDYVVIYDAEDHPNPGQLREAVAAFRAGGPALGCVQARLRYYNARENWLTRQFAIEYLFWFDLLLPGLARLNLPIPLGGTSNHFPVALLRRLNAWDAYNVTEDADLGLRLAQEGFRCGMLDSETYEEATTSLHAWLKQRTRWLKGYMQTYTVHMRRPGRLIERIGLSGFLGFQLIVGGTIAAALLHPLWLFGAPRWTLTNGQPGAIDILCRVLLVVGNAVAIGAGLLAALRRRDFALVAATIFVPVYWILLSVAGYRALWQWLRRPSHWEKTEHGLSGIAPPAAAPPAVTTVERRVA